MNEALTSFPNAHITSDGNYNLISTNINLDSHYNNEMIIINEHMFLILSKSYKVLLCLQLKTNFTHTNICWCLALYILQQLSQMSYRELLRHFHPPFVD